MISGPFGRPNNVERIRRRNVSKIRFLYNTGGGYFVCHLRLPVVCTRGSGTGDLYSHLDSLDIYLRHLLQALRADGEKKMTFDLLFPAIVVFVLMLVGVILTVFEFHKLSKEGQETRSEERGRDGQEG